jgi:ubiquinone/menaquinone biosynthesis C-methylase UbiE
MGGVKSEIVNFFDNIAPQWDQIMNIPSDAKIFAFLKALKIPESGRVLDVGTGTGLMLKGILSYQPSKVFACDISAEMLKIAKRKLKDMNRDMSVHDIEFIHSDASSLPIEDSSIDAVVCNGVYPHFENRPATLSEIHRVMKDGAFLGINHFSGREAINRIHSNSENTAIRSHLLREPEEEAAILEESGFDVVKLIDSADIFRVIAAKVGRTDRR